MNTYVPIPFKVMVLFPPRIISPYAPGESVWVLLTFVTPAAGKDVIAGKEGSVGRFGVPITFPPVGTGPE